MASNVEGSYKRSVTLGMAIGFGNLNGAVTANIVGDIATVPAWFSRCTQYRQEDAPWFRFGHGIVLGYIALAFACTVLLAIMWKRENTRRDRGERDEVIEGTENPRADEKNGRYESVEAARVDKGDEWSGFRYTL